MAPVARPHGTEHGWRLPSSGQRGELFLRPRGSRATAGRLGFLRAEIRTGITLEWRNVDVDLQAWSCIWDFHMSNKSSGIAGATGLQSGRGVWGAGGPMVSAAETQPAGTLRH